MSTFKDAILQVLPDSEFIGDQDAASDTAKTAKRLETAYTTLVDGLRKHANQRLATLGRSLWDTVHHRHVHIAMYDDAPVLTFAVIGNGGPPQGFVLVPPRWIDLVTKEPLMGVGSVIYTGSQAVDFYNDRLSTDGPKVVHGRAFSYEAEFLRGFPQEGLNNYQKAITRDFPQGFDAKYAYDYRPVAPAVS